MPRIPLGQEQQRLNPNHPVSAFSSGEARLMGEATAHLGAGLESFAVDAQRVQDAQTQIDVDTKAEQLKQAAALTSDEAIRSNEKDKVAHFNKLYADRTKDILGADESDPVYQKASVFAERARLVAETHTQYLVGKENEHQLRISLETNLNTKADIVRADPKQATIQLRNGHALIEETASTGVMKGDTTIAVREAFKRILAEAVIDGYAQKKDWAGGNRLLTALAKDTNQPPDLSLSLKPDAALQAGFIDQQKFNELVSSNKDYQYQLTDKKGQKLTPEESQLMLSLKPHEKSAMIAKFKQQAEGESYMRMGELSAWMEGAKVSAANGQPPSDQEFRDKLSMVEAMPGDATHKARIKTDIMLARETMQDATAMQKLSGNDLQKYVTDRTESIKKTGVGDKYITMGQQNRAVGELNNTYDNIMKQRQDDPGAAVLNTSNDLQKSYAMTKTPDPQQRADLSQRFAAQTLAVQSKNGMDNPNILPKAESHELGKRLLGTADPDMLMNAVNGVAQQWGPYGNKVLGEAVKVDKSLESLQLMTFSQDPSWQRAIAENVRNGASIKKSFKESQPEGAFQNISQQVGTQLAPINTIISKAYPDGSMSGLYNAIVEHGVLGSIKSVNQHGGSWKASDISGATKDILSNFQFPAGGSSQVIAPVSIGGRVVNGHIVEDFLNHYSSPAGIESLGLRNVPADAEERKLKFAQVSHEGQWVPTRELDGVMLKIRGDIARRADGSQVIYKYVDIMNNPPPKQPSRIPFADYFKGR